MESNPTTSNTTILNKPSPNPVALKLAFLRDLYDKSPLREVLIFDIFYKIMECVYDFRSFNYIDGTLCSWRVYKDNCIVSHVYCWHPNGVLHMDMPFDDAGNIKGTHYVWHDDGRLAGKKEYV